MLSQAYVDGITDTVTHHIASPLTVGQIAAAKDTVECFSGLSRPLVPWRLRSGHQP